MPKDTKSADGRFLRDCVFFCRLRIADVDKRTDSEREAECGEEIRSGANENAQKHTKASYRENPIGFRKYE